MTKDDTSRIVDQWAAESSSTIEQRSEEASGDGRDDAGALLGLESVTVEKAGFISRIEGDSSCPVPLGPLLGTKLLKSLSKSSERRSTQRVCYDSLLRFGAQIQALTSRKTMRNGLRGCYGFSPGLVPKGMFVRGGRFYLRRHIPCELQSLVGRVEVWRSLKTDSLQSALRRMPSVAAEIEAEFERI